MDLFGVVVVTLVSAQLIHAGAAKLRRGDVVVSFARYEVLPLGAVRLLAPALPWLEIALGLMLVCGVLPGLAVVIAGLTFLLFSAAILINLLRGRSIECGCRGSGRPISWGLLWEDVACAAACSLVAFVGQPAGLVQAVITGTAGPGRALAILAMLSAVLGALTYVIWQEARRASHLLPQSRTTGAVVA